MSTLFSTVISISLECNFSVLSPLNVNRPMWFIVYAFQTLSEPIEAINKKENIVGTNYEVLFSAIQFTHKTWNPISTSTQNSTIGLLHD